MASSRQQEALTSHLNRDKTEYMCFNQEEAISTLNSGYPKLVDKFMYLGSRVSSTERGYSIHPVKAWTAIENVIDHMTVIYPIKSKEIFSKQQSCTDAPHGRWQNV